ncbi:MAG TPA: universal stress protein [Acidimicrobiales bacterium]|nr:universal stress protein [Acidimicrobiales bacterium]
MNRPPGAAPFARILVPLGPGTGPARALGVARSLAERTGASLRVLSVIPPPGPEGPAAPTTDRLSLPPGSDVRHVRYGSVAAAVVAAAGPGTLVCMASHGAYGPARTLAGGVADDVVRTIGGPVLLVGPRADAGALDRGGPVIACLDGPEDAERVLAPARAWAGAFGVPLWRAHVVPDGPPGDRRPGGWSPLPEGPITLRVVHDRDPARGLADLAASAGATALVLAGHGRRGWARVLTGSVVASTVQLSPVPVLVVPAAGRARPPAPARALGRPDATCPS